MEVKRTFWWHIMALKRLANCNVFWQRQTEWTQKAEGKAGRENHGSVQVLWPITTTQVPSHDVMLPEAFCIKINQDQMLIYRVFCLQTLNQCRRGNWITLKMKRLMKTRTRDQEHVCSSTPQLLSESCECLDDLRCNDNGSSVGSQGSEESASNSLNGDTVSPKKSSSEYNLSYTKLSQSSHSSLEHPETSHSVSSKPFIPTSQGQEKENGTICVRRLMWGSQAKHRSHSKSPHKSPLGIRKLLKFYPKQTCHRKLKEEFSSSK